MCLHYFRARYHDAVIGRFLERDPLGYPDGLNTYAAYHVMWGGVDPTGELIIFVHGINNFNRDDSRNMHAALNSAFEREGKPGHGMIHFRYGQKKNVPPDVGDAALGQHSQLNQGAAVELKRLIDSVNSFSDDIRCKEPVYLIAYSNGANVAYNAIGNGAEVDKLILLGSALKGNAEWTLGGHQARVGEIVNFHSSADETAGLVSGGGQHGIQQPHLGGGDNKTGLNNGKITNVAIDNVKHSLGGAQKDGHDLVNSSMDRYRGGQIDPDGYTSWLTDYMTLKYYMDQLPQTDPKRCCLSKQLPLPDGQTLKNDGWVEYRSDPPPNR